MARFEIRADDGKTSVVEALNWMGALGNALDSRGLSSMDVNRVICDMAENGDVQVSDPQSGRTFEIVELKEGEEPPPPAISVDLTDEAPDPAAPPVKQRLAELTEMTLNTEERLAESIDAPEPEGSAAFDAANERSQNRMEALFENSLKIMRQSDDSSAGTLALELVMAVVPAESGAVLLLDEEGESLEFVSAKGPRADAVLGSRIPADAGLAGVSVQSCTALIVREVRSDPRHFNEIDEASGYITQALLAVPLRGPSGVHGCLELLNPFGSGNFKDWHLDAAQMVAARLAARLG